MKKLLLEHRWRRPFVLLVALAGCGFALAAGKIWLAAHWNASAHPEAWQLAARLEPENASYRHKLGVFKQWDMEHSDLQAAAGDYQQAIHLNPRSALYWMDLASVYETLGQIPQARQAYQNARRNHPISSEVAWRCGNFAIRQGDTSQAFAEFRRAISIDPHWTESAVSHAWRATGDISKILTEVLPGRSRHYGIALDYFVSQQEFDAALTVWERWPQQEAQPERRQILPLVDGLIAKERVEAAQRVWRQALNAQHRDQPESGDGSLIDDGGFEREMANAGFGWRETPVAGAKVGYDTAIVHSGTRALRVDFDGSTNLDFQHLVQYVAVQPRRRYRFTATLRTQGISTDSGIRFLLHDPRHPAPETLSEGITGTQPWSAVQMEFTAGPETRMLAVVLRRTPSKKLDNKLAGTVWVDDVNLVPVAGEARSARP